MIIDFHTHCFPDALAGRALEKLTKIAGIAPITDATVSGSIRYMDKCGIDKAVVCNIATNPRQQTNVNNFALSLVGNPRLIPLGSVHPDGDCIPEELERLKKGGIRGIKLHPDYMGYDVDSPAFMRVFRMIEESGMFVIIHAGCDPYSPDHCHASPLMIRRVVEACPTLRLVAAHFGSNMMWDGVEKYLVGKNLWIDTSLTAHGLKPEQAKRIIDGHDPERILFASDMPWSDPKSEADYIRSLGYDDARLEAIFHVNAEKLLGL